MRLSALRRGSVLVSAFCLGLGLGGAGAQEAQFEAPALDTKALDAGASSVAPKAKGKKAKAQPTAPTQAAGTSAAAGKQPANGPNRQFGELEGWSPGKAPPKPADKEHGSAPAKGTGLGMSPSGNMSVGLPF